MSKLIAFITLAAFALAIPASGATTQHFTGGTEQGLKVSFDYASKKVQKFKAKVRCTGSKVQTFSFPSIPVNSKGRFSVHQAGPSIDGRIKGQSAKGTLTLPGCTNAGADEVKFTAHSE
jgi:hypothetical protein